MDGRALITISCPFLRCSLPTVRSTGDLPRLCRCRTRRIASSSTLKDVGSTPGWITYILSDWTPILSNKDFVFLELAIIAAAELYILGSNQASLREVKLIW